MVASLGARSVVTGLYDNFGQALRGHEFHSYDANGFGMIDTHHRLAMYVRVRMSAGHYGYMPDGNTPHEYGARHYSRSIHFLMAGNVNVFAAVTEEMFFGFERVPFEAWENISNHDTCWRDAIDSLITQIYFESCQDVHSHLPEELREAPIRTHTLNGLDRVDFAQISFSRSEGDDYRYDLKKVEQSGHEFKFVPKITEPV